MVDKTFVTMPYDFTIELLKIGGLDKTIEITENGTYDIKQYAKANVGVHIPRCELKILNNTSYRLRLQTVNEDGLYADEVQIAAGKNGTIYGLLDASAENLFNYVFLIRIFGDANIKVASAQAQLMLGKVLEETYTVYACAVAGDTDDIKNATLVFTDA